jgi:hypothetical protein
VLTPRKTRSVAGRPNTSGKKRQRTVPVTSATDRAIAARSLKTQRPGVSVIGGPDRPDCRVKNSNFAAIRISQTHSYRRFRPAQREVDPPARVPRTRRVLCSNRRSMTVVHATVLETALAQYPVHGFHAPRQRWRFYGQAASTAHVPGQTRVTSFSNPIKPPGGRSISARLISTFNKISDCSERSRHGDVPALVERVNR